MKIKLIKRNSFKLLLALFILSLTLSSCQKDLNFESEVVLVNKELIIEYEVIVNGEHTLWIYENQADLVADKNRLQTQSKRINSPVGVTPFKFENINVEEVFIKLRIVNFSGTEVKNFKYEKSIIFPDYSLVLHRRINKTEWTTI